MLNTFIRGTATGSGVCGAARVISNTIWLLLLFLFCKRTAAFASLKVLAEVRGVARCQAAGRQQVRTDALSTLLISEKAAKAKIFCMFNFPPDINRPAGYSLPLPITVG